MARNYQVATEFTITDRATASLNRMSAAGRGLGGAWRNGVAQAQRQLDAFGQSIKTAGKMAVGLGVGAVSAGLAVATKQYAEFDAAVRAAGASYGPAFSQAADFEDKISEIGKAVRAVAAATEFDAVQSANAMKTLAQAGVKSEQAIALLPGVADLATDEGVQSLVDACPKLDGLVNNAGYTHTMLTNFINREALSQQLEVNTIAPILLFQRLLKAKKLSKGSSVVFTSSISGLCCAGLGNVLYSTSKSAINGFVKNAALDLASRNIRINAVAPGMVDTHIYDAGTISAEQLEAERQRYPMKRFGKPEEVAYAIIYLLSDASSFTTGTTIVLDGGVTLQ